MGIIESGRELLKLAEKYHDTELYQLILDLQGQIVALSGQRVEIQEKLLKANERIKELEDAAKLSKKLTLKNEMYWQEGDPLPFCMVCKDKLGKLLHLTKSDMRGYYCPTCHQPFGTDEYIWKVDPPRERDPLYDDI